MSSEATPPLDFVFLAPIPWEGLTQRYQHLARALGAAGRRVLYVEPWAPLLAPLRAPALLDDWRRFAQGPVEVAPGVLRRTPPPVFLPFPNRLRVMRVGNQRLVAPWLRREARVAGLGPYAAVLFSPFADLPGRMGERVSVYDCADEHAAFRWTDGDLYEREEFALAARADVVTVTARSLEEKLARFDPVRVPNGVWPEGWDAPGPLPPEAAALAGPVAMYWGVLSDWFDWEGVAALLAAREDLTCVLVGPTLRAEVPAWAAAHPRVRLPGRRPHAELAAWATRASVLLLPWRVDPVTRAANPVKVYEYLAAGKPVAATRLPELEEFADLIELYDAPGDLPAAVARALEGGDRTAARRARAGASSWAARARVLAEAADRAGAAEEPPAR